MKQLSTEMKQRQQLEWRRAQVLELTSQGYSEREIGSKLQISNITVHRDLMYLKKRGLEILLSPSQAMMVILLQKISINC